MIPAHTGKVTSRETVVAEINAIRMWREFLIDGIGNSKLGNRAAVSNSNPVVPMNIKA